MDKPNNPALFVDRAVLRRLAGRRVFKRGEDYADWGLVLELDSPGTALVAGSRIYQTGLWRRGEEIVFDCDCPMGIAGQVCKHIVAVGLSRQSTNRKRWRETRCENALAQAIRWLVGEKPDPRFRIWQDLALGLLNQLADEGYGIEALRITEGTLKKLVDARAHCVGMEEEAGKFLRLLCERHIAICAGLNSRIASAHRKWMDDWQAANGIDEDIKLNCELNCEENVQAAWRDFTAHPGWLEFQQLKRRASIRSEWSFWRKRATEFMRQAAARIAAGPGMQRGRIRIIKGPPPDASDLVRIWLAEGEIEEAWRAAEQGDCSDELWRKLAALRIRRHPEQALVVYQRLVRRLLGRKDLYSAKEAGKLLRRTRRLFCRLDRAAEFDAFVKALRREFGKQRNFAPTLRRCGLI